MGLWSSQTKELLDLGAVGVSMKQSDLRAVVLRSCGTLELLEYDAVGLFRCWSMMLWS